jgi:hypothetical protein
MELNDFKHYFTEFLRKTFVIFNKREGAKGIISR